MQYIEIKKCEEILKNARRTRWKAEKIFNYFSIFPSRARKGEKYPALPLWRTDRTKGAKARATLLYFPACPAPRFSVRFAYNPLYLRSWKV